MRLRGRNDTELCVWYERNTLLLESYQEDGSGDIEDIVCVKLTDVQARHLYNKIGEFLYNTKVTGGNQK